MQVSLLGLVISFRLGVRLTGDTVMEICAASVMLSNGVFLGSRDEVETVEVVRPGCKPVSKNKRPVGKA